MINLYVHCQSANQWHAEDRFYLDDYQEGSPRRADTAMYFREDTGGLHLDSPTFYQSEAEAVTAAEKAGFRVLRDLR